MNRQISADLESLGLQRGDTVLVRCATKGIKGTGKFSAHPVMRDAVLATGMTTGMETSYARLEGLLVAEPALA